MMTIERLSLSNVRSYGDALVVPGRGLNILTGENGAGKTNILEAISLLAPGRGLRRAALSDIARQNGPGNFAISARIDGISLGVGTDVTAPDRRIVRINGATATAAALSEYLAILWLTPAMDRLFSESAGDRRRFLDRLVLALVPEHALHTTRYEAAMRHRNRLLAGDGKVETAWLDALEAQMAEHGAAISRARSLVVDQLSSSIATTAEGPFARAGLTLSGWEDEGELANELALGRGRDAAAGRTLAGPHRTDLDVFHLAKQQPARHCSTGEQKALLLGIILAHADLVGAQRGKRPILLLDEVAAHLDPIRRQSLYARLEQSGGQVWLTGTEAGLFADAGSASRHFHVSPGQIAIR